MAAFWGVIGYVVLVGAVILLHELGHYLSARVLGVSVNRIGLGLGPVVWQRRLRSGTQFAVGAIPVGGYVRFNRAHVPGDSRVLLHEARPWVRIAVTLAGPAINITAGVMIFSLLAFSRGGLPEARVVDVLPGSPLEIAGAMSGDKVIAIDAEPVAGLQHVALKYGSASMFGRSTHWTLQRGGDTLTVSVAPTHPASVLLDPVRGAGMSRVALSLPAILREDGAEGRLLAGDRIEAIEGVRAASVRDVMRWLQQSESRAAQIEVERRGRAVEVDVPIAVDPHTQERRLGIQLDLPQPHDAVSASTRLSARQSLQEGYRDAIDYLEISLASLYHVITASAPITTLSGPMHIAQSSGDALRGAVRENQLRWLALYVALLSLGIGVINLLPVPVLDGGQLLLIVAESLRGQPTSPLAQHIYHSVGLMMLGVMVMAAAFADYLRAIT